MRRRGKFPNLDKLDYLHFSKVQTRKEKKKKRNQNSKLIEIQKFIYTLFVFSKQHNTTQDKTRIITTTKNGVVFT